MARKAKDSDKKTLFSHLKRVWIDIDISQWASFLSEARPDAEFVQYNGGHVKGRCPFHDDATPSFIVTPGKGIAMCFGCKKMFSSPIALIAGVKKFSYGEAISFAKKRWGLKAAIPDALAQKVSAHEEYQKQKNCLMEFFSQVLYDAMGEYAAGTLDANTSGLWFAKPTIEYLLARRLGESAPNEPVAEEDRPTGEFDQYGVWHAMTGQQLIGVFPPKAMVEAKFGKDSDTTKFFSTYFAAFGYNQLGWLVFPYDDAPDSVCRFKMRQPVKSTGDTKAEQKWVDDDYEEEMDKFRGFYGLRFYRNFLTMKEHGDDGPKEGHVATLHEGEFDNLASIAQQIRRNSEDYIALALGGGSAQSVARLRDYGIKRAWIIGDDDNGGARFTENVLKHTRVKDISFRVFQWPDEYVNWRDPADPEARIKDPDDAIKRIGYPRWARYVCDGARYWLAHEWCYDQASKEISRGSATDIQFVSRVAAEWGRLLYEEQVVAAYCEAIARDYGIDGSLLKRDLWTVDDTENTFLDRLTRVFLANFHIVSRHTEGRKSIIKVWHKESRETSNVVLNEEKSVENLIAQHYGRLDNFIKDKVVEPGFLVPEPDADLAFNVTTKIKRYREYMNLALIEAIRNSAIMDGENTRAQGIHMVEESDHHMLSYMVNGRDVFKLVHDAAGMTVSRLDGPSDGKIMFKNSSSPWCDFIASEADFTTKSDLVEVYQRIHSMICTGWTFKWQDVDTVFLALYVLCLSVMTVFPRQTAIMISAEHHSGKSKFAHGFIGRHQFPQINVVAHALCMPGYTPAGIRQHHSNTSLALCLDEFEDYGGNDKKSVNVRNTLEMFRDLISEAPVKWMMGSASGEGQAFYMRFPLICTAIRPFRDAATLSRFIQFEMAKTTSHVDANVELIKIHGRDGLRRTKEDVLLSVLPHMLSLRQMHGEIQKEYASGDKLPKYAESRFREALYPLMAMLKLLGKLAADQGQPSAVPDYEDFAYRFCESRKEHLSQLTTTTENEQLFQAVLSAPFPIAVVGDRDHLSGFTNIRQMLMKLNELDAINKTLKGVYIDTQMEWLVVDWEEARYGVLNATQWRTTTPGSLKRFSERSPHYVKTEDVKAARTMERMVSVIGPCKPLDGISVFTIKHILDEVRRYEDAARAKTTIEADDKVNTAEHVADGDVVV